jgi:curved DNA-binding protein CbpA
LANYYEILGVDQGAGILEIKTAFRRLAMLYHPDKNPEEQEQFALILKAYETLSDPTLRTTYDYRLQYNLPQTNYSSTAKKSTTKNWRFDEKELKRRRYYDEHIKKHAKTTATQTAAPKSNYNEFKYILFATPLAVALFLLVVKLASPSQAVANTETVATVKSDSVIHKTAAPASDLRNGDAPYAYHFGSGRYDTLKSRTLRIKNFTGMDIVVCLFAKNNFIRNFYIKSDYSAEVSQLPHLPLRIRYSCGKSFDKLSVLKETKLYGAFTESQDFFRNMKPAKLSLQDELTLLPGLNEGFERMAEKDFFNKQD